MARFQGYQQDDDKESFDFTLLKQLWPFVRPYRWAFLLCLLSLFASFGLELLRPYLLRETLDGPVRDALEGTGDREDSLQQVYWLGAWFLGSTLLSVAFGYFYTITTTRSGQQVIRDVRNHLFQHLLSLSPRYFDRNPAGKLVTRITSDVENLNELISTGVLLTLFDLLKIFGLLTAMAFINVKLFLFTLGVAPLVLLLSALFKKHARKNFRSVRGAIAQQNAFAAESVGGISATRVFGQENAVHEHYAKLNAKTRNGWQRTVFFFALFLSLVDAAIHMAQAGLVWFGGNAVLAGDITPGVFIQFWLYFGLLTSPIKELGEKYNVLQSAFASAERIFRILEEQPDPIEPVNPAASPRGPASLHFEQVSFRYDKDKGKRVLDEVTFTAMPGQTVAIVGPTGAGKSTLLSMVTRLQDPDEGQVRLDDVDLRELGLTDLRSRIAVVPQDVFLFSGTILDNVRLFDESIGEDKVQAALERVGAWDFVAAREGGLLAKLEERGGTLSQGQRQLISFARALVQDPDLLILDEATASIDSATEEELQRALQGLLQDRTCLVVAHRLSTVRDADQILVMRDGKIVERGRHGELVAAGGEYQKMVTAL